MNIEIISYQQIDEAVWDSFCVNAENATLLHTRRFLSYHGTRFNDHSVLITKDGKLAGLFPAAESPQNPEKIVSHPGITYGGLLHQGNLGGMLMVEVLCKICRYYAREGYQWLEYKPVPFIYTARPVQDDLYALFRLGAKRLRTDLSCAIDLGNQRPLNQRRKRALKKARLVVTVSSDPALLGDLWGVLAENLARRHETKPVHSLAELTLLREKFPQEIIIRCALIDGLVEAGLVLFNSPMVWHTQYIAASEVAYKVSALDAVFDAVIHEAQQKGVRYFDFGISNEKEGWVLNDGLYRFKSEFGGGGIIHECYELLLDRH